VVNELEALWTSAALVRDMVLGDVDEPSSQATSLSTEAELLKGRIDTTTTNGVQWGGSICVGCHLVIFLDVEV
jgi:hypothetical protein